MAPPLSVASVLLLTTACLAKDVCYEEVGCFTTDYPWSDVRRPYPNLPLPPDQIPTSFYLFTRTVPDKTEIFYNGTDFGDFSPLRKTIIIVHGFTDSGNSGWMNPLKDLLLEQYDYNVILVDWAEGAKIPYLQASANAQLTGRQVALMANALCSIGGAASADMHLIAHSLGCHVTGYAGQRIPGLGRITGLDPAQPYFEGTQPEVHLDASDAEFVDIIHTDGRDIVFIGVGFTTPCGDVDFFPNNGKNQPGCGDFEANIASLIYDLETLDFADIKGLFGCPHDRAHELFRATLIEQSCPFVSFPCANFTDYESGSCQRLDEAVIGRMGMDSIKYNLSGNYWLETTSNTSAFCMHYMEVLLQLSDEQEDGLGNLVFAIHTNSSVSELLPGWSGGTAISAGSELRTTIHSAVDPNQLTSLAITYHGQGPPVSPPLLPSRLRVKRVDTDLHVVTEELCSAVHQVYDKETIVYRPCDPARG